MKKRICSSFWIFAFCTSFFTLLTGCTLEPSDPENGTDDPPSDPVNFDTDRLLLHEVFSGSNCGPCKEADEGIQRILDDNPGEYSVVHYQVGSDPYMSSESVARKMYYLAPTEETYSIPYIHVDGVNGFHPNEVNDDMGYLQSDFDRFQSVPCHMRIEAAHAVDGQSVTVDVLVTAGDAYESENLRLHIAIIENLTVNNVGSNGQTEFHYVMKKMLPNNQGTPLAPMVAGDIYSESFSYTFEGDYNGATSRQNMVNHSIEHTVEEFDDLAVVVFVQDTQTTMIHQSFWSH